MAVHTGRLSVKERLAVKERLYQVLNAAAVRRQRCPGDASLARDLGVGESTIKLLFNVLRDDKRISWRAEYCGTGIGKVRVVTIHATKLSTTKPDFVKRAQGSFRPEFTPTEGGCPVRVLKGPEFEFFKAQYEARDRAERSRAQA